MQNNMITSVPEKSRPLPPAEVLPDSSAQEPLFPCRDTQRMGFRRAAPALVLLILAAVLSIIGMNMGNLAAPHADVTMLPTSFGPWLMTGSEKTDPKALALDSSVAQSLDLDSYTDRNYVNQVTGQQIQILIEYRRLGRGAFNHRPEACYPAAGYVLSGRRVTHINYGGEDARAVTCIADYNGVLGRDHQVLLYWFTSGHRVVSSFLKQQIEMAFGRLQPNKNGWAFIRIISQCPPSENAAALAAEKDFTKDASPAIIRVISTPVKN